MTKESYERTKAWFEERPMVGAALKLVYSRLPLVFLCAYPLLLVTLFFRGDTRFLKVLFVPVAVFVLVNLMRKLIRLPRPAEALGIVPLMEREEKKGSALFSLLGAGGSFWSELPRWAKILLYSIYGIWVLFAVNAAFYVLRPPAGIRFSPSETAAALLCLLISVEPAVPARRGGDSFPSRHSASAAAIAAAFLYVSIPLGLLMSLAAILICVSRPLAGVHFPRDAAAGAIIGIVIGIIGFLVL